MVFFNDENLRKEKLRRTAKKLQNEGPQILCRYRGFEQS